MCAQQIVAAGVLDIKKVVFGGNLGQRQNLNAVRLTIRGVHEQIAEVPQALGVAHGLAHPVNVACTLRGVGHIRDVNGVRPVLVILTTEQRRRLV